MVNREVKRLRTVKKFAEKRQALKNKLCDASLDAEERNQARRALQALPRDASPSRVQRRCRLSGRPHGYYRKFGLARNKLREAAMRGDVPGLVKSSW